MQTNLDDADRADILADAIKIFRAGQQSMTDRATLRARLINAGFSARFVTDTISEEILCAR